MHSTDEITIFSMKSIVVHRYFSLRMRYILKDIIITTIFSQKYALKQQYKENLNIDKGVKNGYSQQRTVRSYPLPLNG